METERDLIVHAASIETLGEFLPWEYECDEYLESLREKCRKKQHTGVIHSLVAQIARIKSVRNTLHERFMPVAGQEDMLKKRRNCLRFLGAG
jgi:hypothetical protein